MISFLLMTGLISARRPKLRIVSADPCPDYPAARAAIRRPKLRNFKLGTETKRARALLGTKRTRWTQKDFRSYAEDMKNVHTKK